MAGRTLLALLCVALPSLAAAGAGGEAGRKLESARGAAKKLDYAKALGLARSALGAGDATPEQSWRIHALIGEVSAAMGHEAQAFESFSRALLLFPSFEL